MICLPTKRLRISLAYNQYIHRHERLFVEAHCRELEAPLKAAEEEVRAAQAELKAQVRGDAMRLLVSAFGSNRGCRVHSSRLVWGVVSTMSIKTTMHDDESLR